MSTDQAEAVSPTVDEVPAPEPTAPARGVDDFLADLDEVLATSTAPTIPAPAPAPAAEPDPEPEAAEPMPDVDRSLDVAGPDTDTTPAATPAPVPAAPAKDWWNDVYRDDAADVDTFTGNIPAAAAAPAPVATPPKPSHAPDALGDQDDVDTVDDAADDDGDDEAPAKKWWWLKTESADDVQDGDGNEEKDAEPAGKTGGQFTAAVKNAGPVVSRLKDGGLVNNPRGRRIIFAGSAYAMGWGLGWDDRLTDLMAHSAQYAIPVTGCALGAGVLGLAAGTKGGGVVFVSSLALITALTMADPARVVGGGVALGCQIAYGFVRGWVGHHGGKWPWKGVVWAAHVPAATATVAFLLYGTN
ncbi:hypothetical protein GCM10012285_61350 [Streptomyces kronopolitis]|uniref:Uncharacterized protein n=1 Tax=Streptomyces kronopolitis TaxID=1612435 RepID=A0ABQ2K1D2_9ACTN|nr:hypothetical protein [Streptomyces kronopolitis]GGN61877.1 hypothetical protein GCM10012285_61350 [Streptomyces kronopolitis]